MPTFSSAAMTFCLRSAGLHAAVGERQLDILVDGEVADQVEGLEDEADLAVPNAGALGGRELGHRLVVEPVLATGRRVEQAQEREQRGLAAAGRAGDGDVLAAAHLEVHLGEGVGLDFIGVEDLLDAFEADQRRAGGCHVLSVEVAKLVT